MTCAGFFHGHCGPHDENLGGNNYFVDDGARLLGVFLKIIPECLAHGRLHRPDDLVVAELGFCPPSNCGSITFTETTAVKPSRKSAGSMSILTFSSSLLSSAYFLRVEVSPTAEPGQMGAAFYSIDVVDE